METSRARSAQRRQLKASARAQDNASEAFNPLIMTQRRTTEPLVNRLYLNWQSIPVPKRAKLYSPLAQVPHAEKTNKQTALSSTSSSSNKQILLPIEPSKSVTLSARKLLQTDAVAVAIFTQSMIDTQCVKRNESLTRSLVLICCVEYAAKDLLMRYILQVIRTGVPVRRSEIPRGKHVQRRVQLEEDVLYLVPCVSPPCGFRNVYWLTFADEDTVLRHGHAEYFTLSCHGFTRFKGGQGVEFSDLAAWVDEKRAFDHMTSMKGLERIQQMIFFFSWKRQASQRRLYRVRERLASSLFTCHPLAGPLLMDVRGVCIAIEQEAEREYIETDTSYTLERLAQIHGERVCAAKTTIARKIHSLCVAISDAIRDISRSKQGQECTYVITDHEAFSKALRFSSLRDRMFTFLRLVDCHVAEAVYQHVTLIVQDLRARICGDLASVSAEQRSGTLCCSEMTENPSRSTCPGLSYLRVNYFIQAQSSDMPLVAVPGLYVSLKDDVDFEGDVTLATMQFVPGKSEVLELVHSILLKYCVAMDELPRVLTHKLFQHILTPFVPSIGREFADTLLKPAHLVLESYEPQLRAMRRALDMHCRRLGILQQEHLRCIRAIKIAEKESPSATTKHETITVLTGEEEDDNRLPELPDLSSSAAVYELAQKTWCRLVQYANCAAPMLQVGYLLLDQRSFVTRLRRHVSKRVAEMEEALPWIYQHFLSSLLADVDGKIDKVTTIPTNLTEASTWLVHVSSMMTTHPFRQRLDMKIANLARLRILIKERGLNTLEPEMQQTIRKLELTWESVIETLLMCLERVEERGSEHRRSVHAVLTKFDEYITGQLQVSIKTFEELPSGCEEEKRETHTHTDKSVKEDLVQQLEDLVAMDMERKNVVQQFEEYDREHRVLMDMPPLQQPVWTSSLSSTSSESLSAVSLTEKLPSELLLLYIITSLELRHWYDTWKKMQNKWIESPLTSVHPGTMINRIKQFRRRLGDASSRLSRLSSVLLRTLPLEQNAQNTPQGQDEDLKECATFTKKDFELMRVFDSSIEEMLNCNRIFQAISGGFSDARWTRMNQLLNAKNSADNRSCFTLRLMKEKCGADRIDAFFDMCDECIVEAKFRVKFEQIRQRLTRIEVRVDETNYSVRCEGIALALSELDEIAVELKLCLFGQNPELQRCLEVQTDLERKIAVCQHILSYQKHWRLRCEATKLHEIDEFFSKRFSGGGVVVTRSRKSLPKVESKQEQTVWQAFVDASHAWSDRLRRLLFMRPQVEQVTNQRSFLGKKTAIATAVSTPLTIPRRLGLVSKSVDCNLNDVMESFQDFDFEANLMACERGIELVQHYLESVREKTPRLYLLDETTMLRLLLRDSDVYQLHQTLAICFPRVPRFAISRAASRVGATVEVFNKPESSSLEPSVRASNNEKTLVILGLEGMRTKVDMMEKSGFFRLPVAKIGRVKFWFTRLEEEMASMVLTDLKRAFEWVTHDVDSSDYDKLLPQSIVTASGLRFTYDINHALQLPSERLLPLQQALNRRLEDLVAMRRTDKSAWSSVRLENLIVLSAMQAEVARYVLEMIEQGQSEDAAFFWSMQFQTRAFVEINTATSNSIVPGKQGKVERNEVFPTSSDFPTVSSSKDSEQLTNLTVYCQVAHLEIPLGQEFVGWSRLAVLSPFMQRCSYALFSALRMHHTALVVPYRADQAGADPVSLLWSISQLLLRPYVEFSCHPSAGMTTIHHLKSLMSATSKLNGFLVVRHLLQLSAGMIGVIQEEMLKQFHLSARVGTHYQQQTVANSLVLPRHNGGMSYGASAVFISLDSSKELDQSGLIRSIQTQFRAVAVSRPAIKYLVECLLLVDGFLPEQTRELHVIEALEAIEAEETGPIGAFNVELLISRIIQEAKRLRHQYRVVWTSTDNLTVNKPEICEGQCVFRRAFDLTIKTLLTEEQEDNSGSSMDRVNTLLARVFPLSTRCRLVTRHKGDEEAVAAAVTIYLENAYALPTDCDQFELIMELWRALQTFPAALVYGSPGSGKTTCITALYRALVALELSQQNQENEEAGRRNSHVNSSPSLTQKLVILNPQLLTLDQFYSSIASSYGAQDDSKRQLSSSSFKWVLIDGEIDGAMLDRLLESDNRACSSASSLPSYSVLYRNQRTSVMSGEYSDVSDRHRLLFEVNNMANLSPSALGRCWALHVPVQCITIASIITGWRSRWETQLCFSPDSRGFKALAAVFKIVDVLVLKICVRFAREEAIPDEVDTEMTNTVGLKLGCLSLNHMTQTALKMVSLCCLENKTLLQELAYLRLVELVAFAVLWGFGGHLAGPSKLKLENYVRVKSHEYSETKHLAELPHSLLDARHFEDVWEELLPRFATSLTVLPASKPEATMASAFDSSSGQVLVLMPAATSLIRVCTMLLHSSRSFLLVGSAASGKTSLLRWLLHRNCEAEAAEMKIETSIDERHGHGIFDWTHLPATWFLPFDQNLSEADSRAKMREESALFAGRSKHSFVFLDDLNTSEQVASKTQMEFIRTMLDHRIGYSTKYGGFQRVEKHIGAGMRLDEFKSRIPVPLERFIRHFVVVRVPTYTQKELLSVFRVKFQQFFKADLNRASTERQLSVGGGISGSSQQLPLEEVVVRASVDFFVEMAALHQITEQKCLYLFNLHHVNMLLERTLVFVTEISTIKRLDTSQRASEGTTLIQLGKTHQSWLSELQNIFLSNLPMESTSLQLVRVDSIVEANGDEMPRKISTLLHHLSEKYFSVAFRGTGDESVPVSVEALYLLVTFVEHHVQAPLLQPRLIQLRELLTEHMTAANGVSRRSSDQKKGVSSVNTSPIELISSVLLEIAAASEAGARLDKKMKTSGRYLSDQVTAIEMKLVLSSSWCLTQAMHLVHALSQQQQVVVSSRNSHSLTHKLLRFACDVHGFKVRVVESPASCAQTLRAALAAAGVCQERVALWIQQRDLDRSCNSHTSDLVAILQGLCLGNLPSLALLPGGEELRDELVLSCIHSRQQLEIVTEMELLTEFQQRLRQNLRLCILEESEDHPDVDMSASRSSLLRWMKTRPSCHWRRLEWTELELQRLVPEVTKAALTSPALCGVAWDLHQTAKYVLLCQKVYWHLMRACPGPVTSTSQLDYLLSFLLHVIVTYQGRLQCHKQNLARRSTALETLEFTRDKVVPRLERFKLTLELQSTKIDSEVEIFLTRQQQTDMEPESSFELIVAPVVEEERWTLCSHYDELMRRKTETKLRLEEVTRFLTQWHHMTERRNELLIKWTRDLSQEKSKTQYEIMNIAIDGSAQHVYHT